MVIYIHSYNFKISKPLVIKPGAQWPQASAYLVYRDWFCLGSWYVCMFVRVCACVHLSQEH